MRQLRPLEHKEVRTWRRSWREPVVVVEFYPEQHRGYALKVSAERKDFDPATQWHYPGITLDYDHLPDSITEVRRLVRAEVKKLFAAEDEWDSAYLDGLEWLLGVLGAKPVERMEGRRHE